MTDQRKLPAEEPESFEERIGLVIDELQLAIHWDRPTLMMVAYGSRYARVDCISMLENSMIDQGQKIVWIHAGDQKRNTLGSWKRIFETSRNTVFFVDGLSEATDVYSILNHHREIFTDLCVRVVFWLTYKETIDLARQAPEFWFGRNRLVEIVCPPKPEQILQSALESAWQGTGEYTDQFDDTEAKISLRESLLTEMPRKSESTAIRANLLLTLGVLNWRKGDYEKANEFLGDAMKIAVKMQDNWFEAECFNAIALVKSSIGKTDEAIDAYKQAIKLAPNQIFAWNNLGNLCLKINRNDEAMIAFQKAIEHNPGDPVAWNGLGDVYSRIEYMDDAIASYRKAIEFSPLLPHAWNGLGEVYAHVGRANEAIPAFQKAIELNRYFIIPWLRLANLYIVQGNSREAVKAYQQALNIDPKNSSIWNDLGCVYRRIEKYEDAADAFLKAVEFDRGNGWAYCNLALTHADQGRYYDSIPLYRKSLELLTADQDQSIVWNHLANAYRGIRDYESAIRAYQKADSLKKCTMMKNILASNDPQTDPVIEDDFAPGTESCQSVEESVLQSVEEPKNGPDPIQSEEAPYWVFQADAINPSTQMTGGSSMQMTLPSFSNILSRPAPAQELLEIEFQKADSTNARVWNEKGNIHIRAGAYEDAIAAFDRAIELDRSFGWPYCNLGLTYLLLGKYAEAILLLQKSLELLESDRDRAVAWNGLGNLYRCLNDYDNAVVAYQKADELDPENSGIRDAVEYFHVEPNTRNAQVWNELGDQFFKSGSCAEASSCYQKAIEMEPLSGISYSNLALCLTYEGKFNKAIPLYLKSIELFRDDKDKAISWNRLGNVYRRLNDYDNAIAAYQNAVKLNSEQMTLVTRARFSLLSNCYVD